MNTNEVVQDFNNFSKKIENLENQIEALKAENEKLVNRLTNKTEWKETIFEINPKGNWTVTVGDPELQKKIMKLAKKISWKCSGY